MVVKYNDRFRVEAEGKLQHVARADKRAVKRADKHLALSDDSAAGVEEQRTQMLLRVESVAGGDPRTDDGWMERFERLGKRRDGATSELERRSEPCRVVAFDVRRAGGDLSQERCETVPQERPRRLQVCRSANVATREKRDQFRVAQGVSPVSAKARGWALTGE